MRKTFSNKNKQKIVSIKSLFGGGILTGKQSKTIAQFDKWTNNLLMCQTVISPPWFPQYLIEIKILALDINTMSPGLEHVFIHYLLVLKTNAKIPLNIYEQTKNKQQSSVGLKSRKK